jgi:Alpha/beta hydrolase domain
MRRISAKSLRPGTLAVAAALVAGTALAVPVSASLGSLPSAAATHVPVPTVAGPVSTVPHLDGTHGIPYTASAVDLASHGYTEQEYFVSGTARAYQPDGALTPDGQWNVTQSSTAPYKTRILVRRPTDMKTFSGKVIVEWLNVTVGRDLDVGWVFGSNGMLHDHDIYVGVSAQANGLTNAVQGAKAWDPERYGSLTHPGDQYSYDIFSQVGAALRNPGQVDPLAGGNVKELIAYGDSQSAFRLVTYLDAVQNNDRVYDGVLVNSRFGNGAALNTGATPPVGTIIRSDTTAKVLELQTETDIIRNNGSGSLAARQPDTDSFRLWEVAGASHFNAPQEATMRLQAFRESPFISPPIQFNSCPVPMNSLRFSDVVDTAIHQLGQWATPGNGQKPQHAPRLAVTDDGTTYIPDANGNTLGGIRLPQVTVPTAIYSGIGNPGPSTCTLAGRTLAFDDAQLSSMYPSHAAYVGQYGAAVRTAVKDGWVQPYDGENALEQAQASPVPATRYVP